MKLILQQNSAIASSTAAFNAGVSMQPPLHMNQGSQQPFQQEHTYPQHHNQHHAGGINQQVHATHLQPQNGPQPFHIQPQVNQQQPQPGYQQLQHTFNQLQAGYYQPQQQYQQSGYPGQQQ